MEPHCDGMLVMERSLWTGGGADDNEGIRMDSFAGLAAKTGKADTFLVGASAAGVLCVIVRILQLWCDVPI
jgi:hypothetical protein